MKKTAYILLAMLALLAAVASCAKVEKIEEPLGDEPIDFSWYASRNTASKADATYYVGGTTLGQEHHLPVGTGFGVFGYFHPQDNGVAGSWSDAGENHPRLLYNEQVGIALDAHNDYQYNYTHSRYWPKNTLDRMSFIAYYPWNELNTTGTASVDAIVEPFLDSRYERDGMVGFYYTVPRASEDQIDFMVSDLCKDQSWALWHSDNTKGLTGNDNGKVKLFFHHALSQVRIKSVAFDTGGNDNVELKINYIIFKNVAVFGQCIPVPDFSTTTVTGRTTVTPTWPTGTLVARRPDLTSGVTAEVCYDAVHDTWDVDNFLLMIPHEFFTDATIEVNFDVFRAKDPVTGEYYSYTGNTLSAPLTTNTVYGWQAGKIYVYNIVLDLKQIKVKADVVDWLDAGEDVILDN